MDKELLSKIQKLEQENSYLQSELDRIKEIYNNTTIGLYRTNPDGEILMANSPLIKMLGFTTFDELRSHNLNQNKLISKNERKKFQKRIENEGLIIGQEAVWKTKTGEDIFIRESAQCTRDSSGKIIFYEGTVENITKQKIKEKELSESKLKYSRLIELLPNGIVIHKENKILYANEYAVDLIKARSQRDLLGQDIFKFVHPDYHEYTKGRIKRILKEFSHANLTEEVFLTVSGNPINVEVITVPYKQDEETFLLTVITDITERKETEKTLKLSEVTYRGMLNSISEAIFIQDIDGKFIDINKTAELLFGYNVEYLNGKNPRDIGFDNRNDFDQIFNQIKSAYNGQREILEYYGKKSDGTIVPVEVTLVPGTYFDKRVVIAVLRDITDRKESEKSLKESERKYRELIDFAVGGILIGTSDGIITEANSYMCSLLGKARKSIVGKHIGDGFFTEESLKRNPLNFDLLKKGKTIINEREVLRPDGTIIPIEMHTKMMPDGTYQSIYHDISARKKAEQEILEAKARAESLNLHKETLLSALPDMLFTFDKDGVVLDYYSNSVSQLVEIPENFLNNKISNFLRKDLSDKALEKIKEVLETKKMAKFQYELDINYKTEFFDAKMVFFKEDTVLTVIRNISERMYLIKDLEDAKRKAEESDKLKSAFLSNLSHEIRTPMNGILGFTELLKDDISNSEKNEYLEIIENSCNQLLLILDDIIEISKIEAGIITKKLVSFEVNSFIKNLHAQMQGMFAKNPNTVLCIADNISQNTINGISDPIKLKQILANFISNALKFTESGYVEIGYEQISDTFVRFWVKDTGIGISQENIDKIFNRFVQVENKLSAISRGSGLGLSICQAYAEILDGTIEVESEIGKGSCFYLTIPIISL
ncbi:MAG: PAS domain S-box protein [Bacteroidales bacterium]|nr:PAS domain S-box protein [Bacteroidales bacterium]